MEEALELCKEIGGSTYVVGGAVRDMLMDKESADIDIATNVDLDDICTRFETHDIGKNKEFGIVVVNWKGKSFEVAHFRADGKYSDHRHPDKVTLVKTIEEDLSRRDFTVNAMAWDGETLIDPYGGQADIKKGIIRFVGDAKKRLKEDALRALRAFRFAAKYRWVMAEETLEAVWNFDLGKVSQERITDELRKVAGYGSMPLAHFIDNITECNISIIPEIQSTTRPHKKKHHPEGNVFEHIIHCLSVSYGKPDETYHKYSGTPRSYITNLCILFHDVGKKESYNREKGGPIFHGHDIKGAEMMKEIGKRMKLTNSEIETIQYVCANHMIWRGLPKMKTAKIIEIALHKDYDILVDVCYHDEMSRLYLASPNKHYGVYMDIKSKIHFIKSKKEFEQKMKVYVDGKLIMKIRPELVGGQIGEVKKATISFITDHKFNVTHEEIQSFILKYQLHVG